ncbi:MAG: hypothetical protein IJX33_09475 [Akkermansia sp.]|nr:hypothetical protein [Akkermansia sp.]
MGYPILKSICAFWESYLKEVGAGGEITIDMEWKEGKVTKYKLSSDSTDEPVTVIVNGEKTKVTPSPETDDDADKPKKKKKHA